MIAVLYGDNCLLQIWMVLQVCFARYPLVAIGKGWCTFNLLVFVSWKCGVGVAFPRWG